LIKSSILTPETCRLLLGQGGLNVKAIGAREVDQFIEQNIGRQNGIKRFSLPGGMWIEKVCRFVREETLEISSFDYCPIIELQPGGWEKPTLYGCIYIEFATYHASSNSREYSSTLPTHPRHFLPQTRRPQRQK